MNTEFPNGQTPNSSVTWRQLRELSGVRKKVRLTRSVPSEPTHNGFVLGMGSELVLLFQFYEFSPRGFTVLRLKDITEVRSAEYERFWGRIVESEGIVSCATPPVFDVPLEGWAPLLDALCARGDNIIVESEDSTRPIEDFYIGKILSVGRNSLEFANFDALGCWDKARDVITFEEITQIQFDTPYIRTISKYLEGPCPHC